MFKVIECNEVGFPLVQVMDCDDSSERFNAFYSELKALLSKHRVHMIAENTSISSSDDNIGDYAHIEFTQYNGTEKYDNDDISFIAEATDIWPDDAVFQECDEEVSA